MTVPVIVDPHGAPLRPSTAASAYQGASVSHADLRAWTPRRYSPRAAVAEGFDLLNSRVQDIARNDGWASAGIERQVDAVIGAGWLLAAQPNAAAIGISIEEAEELADAIEAEFEQYANDPGFYCDAGRRGPIASVLALAFRHRVSDGESCGALMWMERGGPYATAMMVIDPDRVSTPWGRRDSETLFQGVELDPLSSAAVAYHVRSAHPADNVLSGVAASTWERVPRETPWGRPRFVHAFEPRRAGQVRGVSPLAPILKKLKQIGRYDEAELQAATLNAVLAAFVESMGGAADAEKMVGEVLGPLQSGRAAHYADAPVLVDGVEISYGYPGDKLTLTKPGHPNAAFDVFVRAALRNVATAMGISYEQLSMDWSQVNYSSARAAIVEVWRGLTARHANFAAQFMAPWYAAWLEEAIDKGRIRLPRRAKPFAEARAAYVAAEWIPPGRGWVDPLKEVDAAVTRMDGLISTLADETAQQGGDWKKKLRQRAREDRFLASLQLQRGAPARAAGGYPSDPSPAPAAG
jgi:lambda family phage portal protein